MVPDLKAHKLKLPFDLAFCYDEEVGCSSVRPMIAELAKSLRGFQRLQLMIDRALGAAEFLCGSPDTLVPGSGLEGFHTVERW